MRVRFSAVAEVDCEHLCVPDLPITVVGAASFPLGVGLNVSRPLAEVIADDDGVRIRLRINDHRVKFFFFYLVMSESQRATTCAFTWAELEAVDRASRSMILYGVDGRSCRFAVRRARMLEPLAEAIAVRGVNFRPVSSILGWYFNRVRA